MKACIKHLLRLSSLLLLVAGGACSNQNLGDIDETMSERDDMSGPGIFAKDDGSPALSWTIGDDTATDQSASAAATATAATSKPLTEKEEFEQFKAWQELREQGNNSAEYREFQQWLEYRQFKSNE